LRLLLFVSLSPDSVLIYGLMSSTVFANTFFSSLPFFQDDISDRPQMASAISALANYSAVIPSGPADPSDTDAKPPASANLGTLLGVYLPCIQNIFGVILFIREEEAICLDLFYNSLLLFLSSREILVFATKYFIKQLKCRIAL
jgi:hypothetical protein